MVSPAGLFQGWRVSRTKGAGSRLAAVSWVKRITPHAVTITNVVNNFSCACASPLHERSESFLMLLAHPFHEVTFHERSELLLSLGAGLRCKCTTIFRSRQRSMNIFAKYVLFSKFNISVQSLNIFKICDSQRFASCVVLHIKNRVGIRALWIYICGVFSIANENKQMRIHNYFKIHITIRIMWCTNEKHQAL